MATTLTAQYGPMMHRVWCGSFPHFHLLSDDELKQEQTTSKIYFGSIEFATLRTTLRLKLTETQSITSGRQASYLAQLIELVDSYLPYARSIVRHAESSTLPEVVGSTYPPLFYGLSSMTLRMDRLIGRECRIKYTAFIDIVLVYVLLGQLHAFHAEALVESGARLQSENIAQAAEISWRQSALSFTQVTKYTALALQICTETGDQQLVAGMVHFLRKMTSYSKIIGALVEMHRVSTRISMIVVQSDSLGRLARQSVVCTRYALQLLADATTELNVSMDTPLIRQLSWLIKSYAIRWKTLYYSYEQMIFQMDSYPEIAIYFCEKRFRLKIPPLASDHNQDSHFTKVAHEIKMAHTIQLNEAMTEKTSLILLCQQKFGKMWKLETLPSELEEAIEEIPCQETLFVDPRDIDHLSCDSTLDVVVDDHVRQVIEGEGLLKSTSHTSQAPCTVESSILPRQDDANRSTISIPRQIRPSSAQVILHSTATATSSASDGWVSMRVGSKKLCFETTVSSSKKPPIMSLPRQRPATAETRNARRNALPMCIAERTDETSKVDISHASVATDQKKVRPTSSPSYLSIKKSPSNLNIPVDDPNSQALVWTQNHVPCALCEHRYARSNLPGVVVMKRIFDTRRKWGIILQDSKKFSVASALYGKAHVCLMCQEILSYEDEQSLLSDGSTISSSNDLMEKDDIGIMIYNHIIRTWNQQPPVSQTEKLIDVAMNKRARQSSTTLGLGAHHAVEGDFKRFSHTMQEFQPWWEVDLGNYHVIHSIKIWLGDDTTLHHKQKRNKTRGDPSKSDIVGGGHSDLTPLQHSNVGLYPLHLAIMMKQGASRDLDDTIASAVTSHVVSKRPAFQPITWILPLNSRGRFVRIQAEDIAYLCIEKVNVMVAQQLQRASNGTKVRKALQKVAFRAKEEEREESHFTTHDATLAADSLSGQKTSISAFESNQSEGESCNNQNQVEAQRISRLYMKFKNLLDARSKYEVDK